MPDSNQPLPPVAPDENTIPASAVPKPGEAAEDNAPAAIATEEQVWTVLHDCYDPEIPVNVVDLGLIYDVVVTGPRVEVKMTLTMPGCHLAGMIADDVQNRILTLPGIQEANVELVWDPPWNQSMISGEGRKRLGLE